MSQNISGQVSVNLQLNESLAPDALESGSIAIAAGIGQAMQWSFTSGTGAGQADLRFVNSYAIAAGGSVTLTLSALVDGLGRACAFARVRTLLVVNTSQAAGADLAIGGAPTHPWGALTGTASDTIPVHSMGCLLMTAWNTTALVVTAGASDQLLISNPSSAPITCYVVLIGSDA